MAKTFNVTIRGIGYLNGNVNINKTVELDAVVARKFGGSNRDEAILELCRIHYPGVKVERGKVVANIVPIKESSAKVSSEKSNFQPKIPKVQNFRDDNFQDNEQKENKSNSVPSFSGGSMLKSAGSFALGSIANSVMNEIKQNIDEEKERKIEVKNYKNKKDEIIYSEIPTDKSGIFQYANNLIAELKSGGWSDGEDHKNELANACLSKIEQSKYMLIGLGAVNEANYLENEIKKLKKKKFAQKYLAITIACVVLGIVFILYLLGIIHD